MKKSTTVSSTERVRDLLESYDPSKRTWVLTAMMILHYEEGDYWREVGYKSFAAWLQELADKLGVKASLLWRYRRASNFYYELLENQKQSRIKLPDFGDIGHVSPDNLDLVEKLSRVLPRDEVYSLTHKVVTKQIGRRELLSKWQTLRTTLGGRTARGKGVSTPKIGSEGLVGKEEYIEDRIFSVLEEAGPSWMGFQEVNRYIVLRSAAFESLSKFSIDALVVSQEKNSDVLRMDAIDIIVPQGQCAAGYRMPDVTYFDHVWVAMAELPNKDVLDKFPEHVGVICLTGAEMKTVRCAQRTTSSGSQKHVVANELLLKFLPR